MKNLRERQNLSRRKVAVALDVADTTILRWESGFSKPHLPLDKVKALMDLFQCDFETLYAAFEQTHTEYCSDVDLKEDPDAQRQPIAS